MMTLAVGALAADFRQTEFCSWMYFNDCIEINEIAGLLFPFNSSQKRNHCFLLKELLHFQVELLVSMVCVLRGLDVKNSVTAPIDANVPSMFWFTNLETNTSFSLPDDF